MLPGVVLFYATVAMLLAVALVLARETSVIGAGAEALSSACENLALIAIAMRVWVIR